MFRTPSLDPISFSLNVGRRWLVFQIIMHLPATGAHLPQPHFNEMFHGEKWPRNVGERREF